MNKKKTILMLVLVVLSTLFVNLSMTNHADPTSVNIENVEALAAAEGDSHSQVTCVAAGTVCIGINEKNQSGKFPGLRYAPKSK